jgi:nucleoside-diphosphate-sugar epimerase
MNILVLGAGGFIGSHLVKRLKSEGHYVVGMDLKYPDFDTTHADEFIITDLADARSLVFPYLEFDEVYQLAADMGGATYIFTGINDSNIMMHSVRINLNVLDHFKDTKATIFYSSSACIYPAHNQLDPSDPNLEESSAYPANPDSEYGWEKLFSERLYLAHAKNHGTKVRIARYHNVYGPYGTFEGGKEKAPAAICRKVIQSNGEIEIIGPGYQTRSFLYIDDCVDATIQLVRSDVNFPINIGSEEMVSINQLVDIASAVEGKQLIKKHVSGPVGVAGRNSDNTLIEHYLGWERKNTLSDGITKTYKWIKSVIDSRV